MSFNQYGAGLWQPISCICLKEPNLIAQFKANGGYVTNSFHHPENTAQAVHSLLSVTLSFAAAKALFGPL